MPINKAKFQTILYPTKHICSEEALYLHREESFILFDGYFNLFYLEKYHEYCDIRKLELRLVVEGIKKIVIMHDKDVIREVSLEDMSINGVGGAEDKVERFDGAEDRTECHDGKMSFALELPYDEYTDGVFWFKAEPDDIAGDWEIQGAFEGEVNVSHDVKVAIGICTFKREKYVLRNLERMLEYFGNNSDIRALFHVFLVDNGRTLSGIDEFIKLRDKARKIGGDSILTLIENRNTGGTGGFTKVMEEAIEKKEELGLTNLMLLDDDAVFDPEIFLRLVGILKALKPEFEDITVGGAMWREDMPYMLYAFGEYHYKFKVNSPAHMLDLRDFETCIRQELTCNNMDKSLYSGWWCCTYSMKIITKENLPMPLFIHFDDILFCRQHCGGRIALIPGIGVWHQGFELRFPGVNHYYNTRNQLITAAVLDDNAPFEVARWAAKQLTAPLLTFRYEEMNLAYEGIKDFLKGPEWLDHVDGEKLHLNIMGEYKRRVVMKPLEEILDEESYERLKTNKLSEEARKKANMSFWNERRKGKTFKKIVTLNGWILPPDKELGYYCNADSPWSLYKKGKVLLYEPETDRGYIETRKLGEFIKCAGMVIRSAILLIVNYRRVEKGYRKRVKVKKYD